MVLLLSAHASQPDMTNAAQQRASRISTPLLLLPSSCDSEAAKISEHVDPEEPG
jgi:hypothetical protein